MIDFDWIKSIFIVFGVIGGSVIVVLLMLPQIFLIVRFFASILFRLKIIRKRHIIRAEITARLNSAAYYLNKEMPTVFPHKLKIDYINNSDEFAELHDGTVILYVNGSKNPSKVLVTATMHYLQSGVISESRPYIDLQLLKAIDVTLADRLLVNDLNAHQFLRNSYIQDIRSSNDTSALYDMTTTLDEAGVLTRIVLDEFSRLGLILEGKPATAKVRRETIDFTKHVQQVIVREGEQVPLRFLGTKLNTTIALIAEPQKLQMSGLSLYKRKFRFDIDSGTRTIHLLARGIRNVQFAHKIATWAQKVNLVHSITVRSFSEVTTDGALLPVVCINCFSNKLAVPATISPINELYFAIPQVIPSIASGDVEIETLAREKGIRSKIVVKSNTIDNPMPLVIGTNGKYIEELKRILLTKEEIDYIVWSTDASKLIARSLYPLKEKDIASISVDENLGTAKVYVKSPELIGIAIGKDGVKLKLAEKVTGYDIYIDLDPKIAKYETPESEARKIVSQIEMIDSGKVVIKDLYREKGKVTKVLIKSIDGKHAAKDCYDSFRSHDVYNLIKETVIFVDWTENPKDLIINALYPLPHDEVVEVRLDNNQKTATVIVATFQGKNEAVGKGGQNVASAAKLLGYRSINIKVTDNR